MPRLTAAFHGGREEREAVGGDRGVGRAEANERRDERTEGGSEETEEERRKQGSPWRPSGGQRGWLCLALAGVVWSVCQEEAPLHPALCLPQLSSRLLGLLGLAGCILALRSYLEPGQAGWILATPLGSRHKRPLPPQLTGEAVPAQATRRQDSWGLPGPLAPRPAEGPLPLAWALADGLVICVLHEPLLDPSLPHIQALLCRLTAVSLSLERAAVQTGARSEERTDARRDGKGKSEERRDRSEEEDPALTDRLRHIGVYLEQRAGRLRSLLQVQGRFQAGVSELRGALRRLWARLEELHTGVTLTKGAAEDGEVLHAAGTATRHLSIELDQNRSRFHSCQTQLKETTMVLQELAWGHTHIGHCLNTSIESVWPEVLLQFNIEQFDKVQESFLSLEQQTSTFQAHLEGLVESREEGPLSPLAQLMPPPSSSSSSSASSSRGHAPATPPEYISSSPFSSSLPSPPSLLPSTERENSPSVRKRSTLEQAMGCFSSRRSRQ